MDGVVEETWRDARRGRILAAATRVFGRTTFEQASMDEIAHEAGVGKPTLYRYYPSKDALFASVFEHALDDLESRLDRVLSETRGAAAQLSAVVAEIVPTIRQHLVSLRFLGGTAAAADMSKRRVFRERRARIARYLGRAIDGGVASGEMRALDSTRVGQIAIGMLWSASANIQAPDDEIARDVVDLILNGLSSRRRAEAVQDQALHLRAAPKSAAAPNPAAGPNPAAAQSLAPAPAFGPARASDAAEAPCRSAAVTDISPPMPSRMAVSGGVRD